MRSWYLKIEFSGIKIIYIFKYDIQLSNFMWYHCYTEVYYEWQEYWVQRPIWVYTFKKEIIDELGEETWQRLIKEIDLPDIENESKCKCINMYSFMYRFDQTVDKHTANKILSRVRHGLKPSQCA